MATAIMECGWMAWPTIVAGTGGVALAFIGIGLGIARMRSVALGVSALALVFAALAFGGGWLGRSLGRSTVDDVIAAVDPDVRDELREEGYREAAQCTTVGGAAATPALLVGTGALALALIRRR